MAVRVVQGNLLLAEADTLVNPVNCLGVQGAGLARQFRDRFPELDAEYRELCRSRLLRLGNPLLSSDGRVLWFPTKHHWRERSRLWDIDRGLQAFVQRWGDDSRSWAFPALGCGLGGLSWDDVLPRMQAKLGEVRGDALVYSPQQAPSRRTQVLGGKAEA